jgi:hypothetical protein
MEVSYYRFPSGKEYTYVLENSKPIFLRNIIFLRNVHDPKTIAIVHEWGKKDNRWEPPKGQMEWKEYSDLNIQPNTVLSLPQIQTQMRKGILREMTEESYILLKEVKDFHMLPLSYIQDWPESGIKGAKFMYQYWTASITEDIMNKAKERLRAIVSNPDLKLILPPDVCEKDAIEWWSPTKGWKKIRSGFSQKMTRLYYKYVHEHGVS